MEFPTHIVAAAGYVFDQKGNLLLVKTNDRGYDCTGGQVENGETLEEGVLREIWEESGIMASVRCLCGVYSNVGSYLARDGETKISTKVMFDFVCDYVKGETRISEETSEVLWVPREKVLSYVTSPAIRYRFEKILNFNGKITYSSYVTKPEFRLLSERII